MELITHTEKETERERHTEKERERDPQSDLLTSNDP